MHMIADGMSQLDYWNWGIMLSFRNRNCIYSNTNNANIIIMFIIIIR